MYNGMGNLNEKHCAKWNYTEVHAAILVKT